ncbi:hypothetical protein EGW08_018565, partial [Elysia chlorotica]
MHFRMASVMVGLLAFAVLSQFGVNAGPVPSNEENEKCDALLKACSTSFSKDLFRSMLRADLLCRALNSFISCLNNVACPHHEHIKQQAVDTITPTVLDKAPGCQLIALGSGGAETTTEASTTVADATSKIMWSASPVTEAIVELTTKAPMTTDDNTDAIEKECTPALNECANKYQTDLGDGWFTVDKLCRCVARLRSFIYSVMLVCTPMR